MRLINVRYTKPQRNNESIVTIGRNTQEKKYNRGTLCDPSVNNIFIDVIK